jgi:hypothetical protein
MIEFDINKIQIVTLDKVKPNSWNPKHKDTAEYRKIKSSIEREGQKVPIVVREKSGSLEIIDGQQRWTAMQELGMKKICINNRGKVSDKDAMNGTLWYQLQVPLDVKQTASLVEELKAEGLETAFDFSAIQEFDTISFEQPKLDTTPKEKQFTLDITMERSKYEIITGTLEAIVEQHQLNDFSEALQVICASYGKDNR